MKRHVATAAALSVLALALSCRSRSGDDGRGTPSSSSGGEIDAGTFDKGALLRAFGECALGTYRQVATRAAELETAARAAEADPNAKPAAQEAWRRAIDVWQVAEVFQFGPAAMTGSPGARDMRDPIYAWPLVSRCQIDQTLEAKVYETPDFGALSLVSTRTLGALEYLLFDGSAENGCPPEDPLNAQGKWAALGADELAKRKAAYARVIAVDVVARANRLADAWDPAKENFLLTFAGAPNATFASQQMAFNAVTDAMFYLDDQVKNMKVGVPAGLLPECAAPPCVDAVESRWAKASKANLRANVLGYEQLLVGCSAGALGFDDLLGAVGAPHVTEKLVASVAAIRAALDALTEPTFEEDLMKNPAGVKALFEALRANATVMKSEFLTVLDLEIPRRVEGDND
jgi:predicted lipoprotein